MSSEPLSVEPALSFVSRETFKKLAWENGFRLDKGEHDGWAHFGSTTAKGTIAFASAGKDGPWCIATDHPGVAAELSIPQTEMPGPGVARYAFETVAAMYEVMPKIYALGVSLPDGPLQTYIEKTKDLPKSTEAERLVVQRVGQNVFRESLMQYWAGTCPLTGITEPELLRASHIIPWKDCPDDAERLNTFNGLLLSALWDAAFDKGLVGFQDDGVPMFSSELSDATRRELRWSSPIPLKDEHISRLRWHRDNLFSQ